MNNFKELAYRLWFRIIQYFLPRKGNDILNKVYRATAINFKQKELKISHFLETHNELKDSSKPISSNNDTLRFIEELTAADLTLLIDDSKKQRILKSEYDFIEIESILNSLNSKSLELSLKLRQIDFPVFPVVIDSYSYSNRLNNSQKNHESLFNADGLSGLNAYSQNEKKLTITIKELTLNKIFEKRQDLKRAEIQNLLRTITDKIHQKHFKDAKDAIFRVESYLKYNPRDRDTTKQLIKAKDKLKKAEEEETLKILIEQTRKAKEVEEQKKLAEDKRKEEERIRREQEEIILKQREQELKTKHDYLQSLLVKRHNWQEFERILSDKNVKKLFHFTDRANVKSIIENKGLFSWDYCRKNNIQVTYEGGGSLSKDLDLKYNLQDYVRVCFTREHPMMYVAKDEGRIHNPVILEISTDVCFFTPTKFSDMNATKTGHNCGNSLEDLKCIRLDYFQKFKRHFDIPNNDDRKYFQAEVLVKTWIPLNFITNIDAFR